MKQNCWQIANQRIIPENGYLIAEIFHVFSS